MLVFLCTYSHAKIRIVICILTSKNRLHIKFCSTIYKITSVISQKNGQEKFPSADKLRHLPMSGEGYV